VVERVKVLTFCVGGEEDDMVEGRKVVVEDRRGVVLGSAEGQLVAAFCTQAYEALSTLISFNGDLELTFQVVKEGGERVALQVWLEDDEHRVAGARLCPCNVEETEERKEEDCAKGRQHSRVSGPRSLTLTDKPFSMMVKEESFQGARLQAGLKRWTRS
jgi:hypothetical protein